MSIPKPPFHSTLEEILYNIYLKLPEMGSSSFTADDINTLAKLNAILTDAELMKAEDILAAIVASANTLKGNVPEAGNSLEKIYNIIQTLNYLKQEHIDTIEELNAILINADVAKATDLTNAITTLMGNVPNTGDTLEKLHAFAIIGAKNRIAAFHFESNLFTEDEILLRGQINSLFQDLSNSLSAVSYESRLDAIDVWTAHADLASLQAWITANVNGNEETGQKFWIKCLATYKPNRTGEAENIFFYKLV